MFQTNEIPVPFSIYTIFYSPPFSIYNEFHPIPRQGYEQFIGLDFRDLTLCKGHDLLMTLVIVNQPHLPPTNHPSSATPRSEELNHVEIIARRHLGECVLRQHLHRRWITIECSHDGGKQQNQSPTHVVSDGPPAGCAQAGWSKLCARRWGRLESTHQRFTALIWAARGRQKVAAKEPTAVSASGDWDVIC